MNKKGIIAIVLALVMCFSFAGCKKTVTSSSTKSGSILSSLFSSNSSTLYNSSKSAASSMPTSSGSLSSMSLSSSMSSKSGS